jgi:hypothetical protein
MSETTKHYVTFYYPGSFFDEEETRPVKRRGEVGAIPRGAFGYQEWDREERTIDGEKLLGKPKNHGPLTYFGEEFTAEQVAALPGDHAILLSNMRGNDYERVVRTIRGNWKPVEKNVRVLATAPK